MASRKSPLPAAPVARSSSVCRVTINPIRLIDGGHHFNEVVFDDVVVPGDMLLGEEGNGWHQVSAELAFERLSEFTYKE